MSSIAVSRELQAVLARQGLRGPQLTQDSFSETAGRGGLAHHENASAGLKNSRARPDARRFSFDDQGEPLPGIYEATPMEMAAQFAIIERGQIHRRSYDMDTPACRIDRNLAAKIIVRAHAMERETYKHRKRYQRRGALGDLSIALLWALLNFGRKYGKIYPCYDTLAAMLRKDKEAVIEAMKRLIKHEFVTKHRRSKLISTPQGQRRVQDSNAYEVHMPNAGLALVVASGSDNPGVSVSRPGIKNATIAQRPEDRRWWMAEPWRMADGSVY